MDPAHTKTSRNSHAVSSEVELENLLPAAQRRSKAVGDATDNSQSPRATSIQIVANGDRPGSSEWISRFSRRARWSSLWLHKIDAIVLSLVFMSTIIVVLKNIDGKPMGSWNMPLSPNTLIAIFSTLSKSAILLVISGCLGQLKWVYFEQRGQRLMDRRCQ